jgi:hypothetical protein
MAVIAEWHVTWLGRLGRPYLRPETCCVVVSNN